ncbi:MAG: pyridoxal-phosphate dependent enzyme [Cytophagales bacterium]|nr:pyridoxal-phosphate dependent enzyme [Cytophagales bacterium]
MFDKTISTPIIKIHDESIEKHGLELYIKREDLNDAYISGNKYRKLKYNLLFAKKQGYETLLTFGGAYSNHIHAVAYAGFKHGFKTIGIIRGEETLPHNPTLQEAAYFGMKFYYVSRSEYRNKTSIEFISNLKKQFGGFYLIPEGGSNLLAVKGCAEILDKDEKKFNHICCACGTGGTIAGLISSLGGSNMVWGFPALKNGGFLKKDISRLISEYTPASHNNWNLILDYHFGGYAKFAPELIDFINQFKRNHSIQLDPIYTGKMLYGIFDKVGKGFFPPNEKILAIHTGGVQGIKGFNERFGNLLK